VPQIYFWNAEHLSTNAEVIADRSAAREAKARLDRLKQAASKRSVATPPITRSMTRVDLKKRVTKGAPTRLPPSNLERAVRRQMETELSLLRKIRKFEYLATVSRRKVETQTWLNSRADPKFYCEVQQAFPGITSSLRNAVAPGAQTLCYLTNVGGGLAEPANFPGVGAGVGPPGGPHLTIGSSRIPKVGVHGGANLFFWHAPSGNNGQVIAAAWAFINANYVGHNILFGDLNADPGQVVAHGVPLGEVFAPPEPTRISGRTLDYALSNQPVAVVRAFDAGTPYWDIKKRFGSDHAAMCVRW
jgi:hypothetical protein